MKHCNCSLRQKTLGDGCELCNTDYLIEILPSPEELCEELEGGYLSSDQAYTIASDVYQPLLGLIEVLNTKIKNIETKLDKKESLT